MNHSNTVSPATPIFSVAGSLLDSSLIRQTNKVNYNIRLVDCNNYIQVYEYQESKYKNNPNLVAIKTDFEEKKENNKRIEFSKEKKASCDYQIIRKDNAMRSKLSLERLIKANDLEFKSFITLTFADNVTSIDKANEIFNIWRTRIKKILPNFKYVCVPEYQKRGAVHYHIVSNIKINSLLLPLQKNESSKYDVLYWNSGFTSAFPIEDINVVSYMSKYMTKDMDNRLYGRKRYFYSKNLYIPKTQYIDTNDNRAYEYMNKLLENKKLVYESSYANSYSLEITNFKEFGY